MRMRPTRLFCAIGVITWSAVVTCSQAAPTVLLPAALRTHVMNERLDLVTSIRGLPLASATRCKRCLAARPSTSRSQEARFSSPAWPAIRSGRPAGWPRRGARPITASSTTSAAAAPTRGTWRSFTGRRQGRDSNGAVSPRAASRQSTTFETPPCLEPSKFRQALVIERRLFLQGNHRVDARRAPSRNETGQRRNTDENQGHGCDR